MFCRTYANLLYCFALLCLVALAVYSGAFLTSVKPVGQGPLVDVGAAPVVKTSRSFSVVLLTYKAPKSLANTLRSLFWGRLLFHRDLLEVVVYFQVLEELKHRSFVDELFAEFEENAPGLLAQTPSPRPNERVVRDAAAYALPPHKTIGDPRNLPVAQATFAALRTVKSEYVLYLECDRPLLPMSHIHVSAVDIVSDGLRLLEDNTAELVRLQLYAGANMADTVLPSHAYTPNSTHYCSMAARFTAEQCAGFHKGSRQQRMIYGAYCKHWKKFVMQQPQKDLCDSFCFREWVRQHPTKKNSGLVQRRAGNTTIVVGNLTEAHEFYCVTSAECNWTNQPTLYSVEWYKTAVMAPCERDANACLGSPGRASAVRQEVYFLRHDDAWRNRKYKICVSSGLFYHHEIDNRE